MFHGIANVAAVDRGSLPPQYPWGSSRVHVLSDGERSGQGGSPLPRNAAAPSGAEQRHRCMGAFVDKQLFVQT